MKAINPANYDVFPGQIEVPFADIEEPRILNIGPRGEIIPEFWEFKLKPKPLMGPLDKFPGLGWLAPGLVFLAISFAVSLWSWGSPGLNLATSGNDLFQKGYVLNLFTALFAHGSLEHFFSNALPLLVFSWLLAGYFGLWLFPVFPLFIGALSNLVTVSFYNPTTYLLGASGMIYGMFALWLVLFLKFSKEKKWAVRWLRAAGFVVILLLPSQYEQNVSYLAHASGFVVGMGTGFVVLPYTTPSKSRQPV